ncbi:MAG: hypothetical protein AAFU79_14270, partial [Myxococcota bacterium]
MVPGARYKITRRCLERRFFMTPDRPEVEQALGYVLGVCLREYGLQLHAACFMANHYHLDVTDVRGNFPAFKCKLNSLIAKALNALRGRFDAFWSADPPCDVELVSEDDVVDRMAYTLANPVAAELVRRSTRWPGLTTAGWSFGESRCYDRPEFYFDPENDDMPEAAEITVVRPAVLAGLSDDEFEKLLLSKVAEREAEAGETLRREHRRVLGESRILKQHWNKAPKSREDRFGLRPTVAASNKWARVAALQREDGSF